MAITTTIIGIISVSASAALGLLHRGTGTVETFDQCYERVYSRFEGWISLSDDIGFLGMGSSVATIATSGFASLAEEAAINAENAARTAHFWSKEMGVIKWAKRFQLMNNGAATAAKIAAFRSALGVVGKATGILGLSATAISVISRDSVIAYCTTLTM